jgi:hypothetical protein
LLVTHEDKKQALAAKVTTAPKAARTSVRKTAPAN